MGKLSLFSSQHHFRNWLAKLRVPLTPVRVLIAVISSFLMTVGVAINGLHWSGIEPSFQFDVAAMVGLVLALLVIFSGTFASSRWLRLATFSLTLIVASFVGSATWFGRLVVAAVMITIALGAPRVSQRVRRRRYGSHTKSPRSALAPPTTGAVAALVLVLGVVAGLAEQPLAMASMQAASQGTACDAATIAVSRDGEQVELAADAITIDLPGGRETYVFEAVAARPANVTVSFDALEPWDFADDVVLWADTVSAGEPSEYVVDIRRGGLLGVYEMRFGEATTRLDRGPVPTVPGRTTLLAEFTFLDGEELQQCQITVDIQLRAQPYATLPGLLSLVVTGAVCASISPNRPGSSGPPIPTAPSFEVVSAQVAGQPVSTNAGCPRAQIAPNDTEPFAVTLRVKLDENDDAVERQELAANGVPLNELLTLIDVKGAVSVGSGFKEVTLTGQVRTGDGAGLCRVQLEFDYLSETQAVPFEFVVGDDSVIDARNPRSGDGLVTTQPSVQKGQSHALQS